MRGTMVSPSATAKAPPGMKSFWTSMTRSASVGWTELHGGLMVVQWAGNAVVPFSTPNEQ